MDAMQFEPMSVGGILDKTFTLYRRNFLRFITIVAVIQTPIALISLIWTSTLVQGIPDGSAAQVGTPEYRGPEAASLAIIAAGSMVTLLTTVVGHALCQGALARSVSEAYLGNEITVGQTFRGVLPKLMPLIGASILVGLVVGLGFLLLVVPGVIFGLWFFVATPSIIVENQGVISGMSRSKALVSGNLGKVFAVGLLVWLIAMVISVPMAWIATFASAVLAGGNATLGLFISQFAGLVGEVLAAPVGAAAAILLYYDLRIRKEGFDLQMLAQSMASNQGQNGDFRLPQNA